MIDVATFYDRVAPHYDMAYTRPVDVAEDRLTGSVLDRYIDGTSFVLDVGCGTGHLLSITTREPEYYAGIDISDGMLEVARARHGDQFHKVDMMNMPWDDGQFDVVACINEVTAYTPDFDALVANMRRACSVACVLSAPLPRHRSRQVLAQSAPSKVYRPLNEMVDTMSKHFSEVDVTTYSSALHDRMPGWMLAKVGVRCPEAMAYYAIIEARV